MRAASLNQSILKLKLDNALALYVLEEKPIFRRDHLVEFMVDKEKPYTLLGFCEGKDKNKPKLLIQVKNEHVDLIKKYFTQSDDNVLADGTLLGDPVPKMRITSSGVSGTHGGRFGCTRSDPTKKCNDTKGKKYHGGVDIHAPIGTTIRSISSGTVFAASVEEHKDLGYYVIIKSNLPDKKVLYLLYAHLKESSDATSSIEKGGEIGISGITGNAKHLKSQKDSQHVHIITKLGNEGDSYQKATRVNPENYLATKFDENGNPR